MAESAPGDRLTPARATGGPGATAHDTRPTVTHGFLFADLRDYTKYVETHGDHAAAELLDRYRRLVRGVVAAVGGAEIKTEGDSFYVVFDSASAAVACGLAIIAAATDSDQGPADPIRVGIGVHAGETVETTEGFVGSAVNIASRLCAQAKAGELVVSETVRLLTRTYLDVAFEPLGRRQLKGVEEPVALYRVVPRGPMTLYPVTGRRAGTHRRLWIAGIAAIALVVVLGAGDAVISQEGRQPPIAAPSKVRGVTPSVVATAMSTEPAASGGIGGLTAAEQALLAQIPLDFQPYCRRSNLPDGSLGGDLASLRCDLPLDTSSAFGADSVWYDAFSTPGLVAITMNGVAEREKLPVGECGPDSGAAVGRWSMGITFTGQLACYAKNGAAWIVWTYDGEQIAARAVRRDGDAKRLYTWWHEEASIYLR